MNQRELAEATGIARPDINAYCKGRKRLGGKNAPKIAKALELSADYFTPQPRPSPEFEQLQKRVEELLRDVADLRRHLNRETL